LVNGHHHTSQILFFKVNYRIGGAMDIVHTIDEVRERVSTAKRAEKRVGFVPTMGYLHEGHLSLVKVSRQYSDYQVMSIFVNRIQFNDKTDFESYPVDLERDFALAEEVGIDLMFVPDEGEIYRDHLTYVDVEKITEHLCGGTRPGHFKGVFTVVSKLFNIVLPDISVFGQKDIQQAIAIEKMTRDLNFPVKIILGQTIREEDGLAMSSRNKHLNPEDRKNAVSIYRSLEKAEKLIQSGEDKRKIILKTMKETIEGGHPSRIDYISLVNYHNLQPIEELSDKSVIAVAAFYGETRLIDNMIIERKDGGYTCTY
jgi:pantoate--beta-alanine ligase